MTKPKPKPTTPASTPSADPADDAPALDAAAEKPPAAVRPVRKKPTAPAKPKRSGGKIHRVARGVSRRAEGFGPEPRFGSIDEAIRASEAEDNAPRRGRSPSGRDGGNWF